MSMWGQSAILELRRTLLLQNGIVAVADQASAHGFGILDVGERANLNVEKLVGGGRAGYEGGVLFLLQSVDQGLAVFLLAHGCHLHEIARSGKRGRGIGSIGLARLSLRGGLGVGWTG